MPESREAERRERIARVLRASAIPLFLVVATLVVFHPIAFRGFTFARASLAARMDVTYGDTRTMPILDPGAAAAQDEAWLFLHRRNLARGEPSLVNMQNGLGAPLVESMQPGSFYLLNPLLLLFDPESPWLFDGFVLVHIAAFVIGLYALARLYARPAIACATALAVGFTGVTYQHLDMVHYRSLVWLPLSMYAAIRFARATAGWKTFVLLVLAHLASLTAGAIQEVFTSTLAMAFVFVVELARAPGEKRAKLARAAWVCVALACSICIGAVAYLPYLEARASGDIFTATDPGRSMHGLAPDGMATLLVPKVNGIWPHLYRPFEAPWFTDFSTSGVYFALLAVVVALATPRVLGARRAFVLALSAAAFLVLLKVQHVPWLDFVSKIPFLNEIRYVKYSYFLFVWFALLGAIGLESVARLEDRERKRVVIRAAIVLALLLAPIAWLFLSQRWKVPENLPAVVRAESRWIYGSSALALVASIALLYRMPRRAFAWMSVVLLALAVCVRPDGWYKRAATYGTPPEARQSRAIRALRAAPITDENWTNGVCPRDRAGFCVLDPTNLRGLAHGSRLRFARSGVRAIAEIAGDQVWVDGPVLDPIGDGSPYLIESLDAVEPPPQRILSILGANTNVIAGFESPCVFDPITNRRFREFMAARFEVLNPFFDVQLFCRPRMGLRADEIDWLRFLGVTRIYGHKVNFDEGVKHLDDGSVEIEGTLPRVMLLEKETCARIERDFATIPIAESLERLRDECARNPQPTGFAIGANGLSFQVEREFEGVLIALQAYSRAWRLDGAPARPAFDLMTAWDVNLSPARTVRIEYDPPGLELSFGLAAFGVALASCASFLLAKRRAS